MVSYGGEEVKLLQECAESAAMQRLKKVGMDCGCEYTSFPLFLNKPRYDRYMHSFGVSQIVYHFTKDEKQALAGLFHDISTAAFAHVIDFLHQDYLLQESTEEKTREMIEKDETIARLLKQEGITVEEVCDYHIYPIADNDSPQLSADRLEYSLVNMERYLKRGEEELQRYYDDLVVGINEKGEEELCFQNKELAEAFALDALNTGKIYSSDPDRYIMEYLARILQIAITKGLFIEADLFQGEAWIIEQLKKEEEVKAMWEKLTSFSEIVTSSIPEDEMFFKINAKKRYIDPYVVNKGRVSSFSFKFKEQLDAYLQLSYDYYVKAL